MQAVILAAGRGKRLYPITSRRSKAMLPVLGKPIIGRIVESLVSNGIHDFIIVISPNDQQIIEYFYKNAPQEAAFHFVKQPAPKGMAHALVCAKDYIRGEFLLSACDSLLPSNAYAKLLSSWNIHPRADALLTLQKVESEKIPQTAIVKIENDCITGIIEKPSPGQAVSNIASLPIYIFQPIILDYLGEIKPSPRGELELQDAIQALIYKPGSVRGILVEERLDLTSAKDLLNINLHFLHTEKTRTVQDCVQIGENVVLLPPYWIGAQTIIGDDCTIGPNVFIEYACHIEDHCQVTNSVLLAGSKLAKNQDINLQIID